MHGLLKSSMLLLRKVCKEARKDNAHRNMQKLLDKPSGPQEIQEDKLSFFSNF